tara:strand:- start:384 stop:638 length:255 start_codon:yes stop_codon:yes gene_type:complete
VEWSDGTKTFYPTEYLRHHSPSAEMAELRKEMKTNPLTVLPNNFTKIIELVDIEPIGLYAVKIHFSDGHNTGIYSWEYLQKIKT